MAATAATAAGRPCQFACVGYGRRGSTYSQYTVENPDKSKLVAVADPKQERIREARAKHGADIQSFDSWQAMARQWGSIGSDIDFVIIATQDTDHIEPALAFTQLGVNILLEKPMASTPIDCMRLLYAVDEAHTLFSVCHVLDYMAAYAADESYHTKKPVTISDFVSRFSMSVDFP